MGISEAEMPTGPRVGLRQGLPGGFDRAPRTVLQADAARAALPPYAARAI